MLIGKGRNTVIPIAVNKPKTQLGADIITTYFCLFSSRSAKQHLFQRIGAMPDFSLFFFFSFPEFLLSTYGLAAESWRKLRGTQCFAYFSLKLKRLQYT